MKCLICNKPIKENKEGNNRYCQGHSILENPHEQKGKNPSKIEEKQCDTCGAFISDLDYINGDGLCNNCPPKQKGKKQKGECQHNHTSLKPNLKSWCYDCNKMID